VNLRDAWEAEAHNWLAWARTPDHDSYWHFHRDAFLAGLPGPPLRVVDVGCGEGRLTRDLKRLGHRVVGVDSSPTLIEAAREADPDGQYHLADAAALPLDDASADLVVAFMSPQDIDDLDGALQEVARVLVPGGRLRMALVHPTNSAGHFTSREPDAIFEIAGSYLDERRTEETIQSAGLTMTFTSIHRPLEGIARGIFAAGMLIDHVAEPPDTSEPPAGRWRRLPLFLHLGAVKPEA